MKLIDVSTKKYPNAFAIVDDEDFERLNQWTWTAVRRRNSMYALRSGSICGATKTYMHREVMGISDADTIDHRDRNGLNNQRQNLRFASHSQNIQNSRVSKNNTSGLRGVSWNKNAKKWESYLMVNKKKQYFGRYDDPILAAKIRDAAAIEHYGEFASLNLL